MPSATLSALSLLSLALAWGAGAPALTRTQLTLLAGGRYQVRADGTVWAPDGTGPFQAEELSYLLRRMESAQRLKALLKIQLILIKSDGEKNLAPAESAEIRTVLRENWPLFPVSTRRKFRGHFTLEELAGLDRDPAPIDTESDEPPPLRDPELDQHELAAELPAAAAAATPAAAASVGLAALQAALSAAPPPAAPVIPPPAPVAAAAPAVPAAAAPAAAAVPPADPVAAMVPAAGPVVAAPAAVAAVAAATAIASEPVPIPEVGSAEFEKFLLEAPFSRDAKSLLRLISRHAPEPARTRALSAAMTSMPQILVDGGRVGSQLRGRLLSEPPASGRKAHVIALSPGPVLISRRRFLTRQELLLPQSSEGYEALRMTKAAVDAARPESVAGSEQGGDWGMTRRYADGSLRGTFSHQQQAGTLLALLLRLDAGERGWDAWPLAAELHGRTAQWLFYASVEAELRNDSFLDPALRASYRQWLADPQEARDHWVHAWTSGRGRALDPYGPGTGPLGASADERALLPCDEIPSAIQAEALKEEAQAFVAAGLADETALAASRQSLDGTSHGPPPSDAALCARDPAALAAGRRQARLLLSGISQAELRFHESRRRGDDDR